MTDVPDFRTNHGFLRWCETPIPDKPDLLNRAQFNKLKPDDQTAWNEQRSLHNAALPTLGTPHVKEIEAKLNKLVKLQERKPGLRGLIVTGNSTLGKTTALRAWAKRFDRDQRESYPELDAAEGQRFMPVVSIEAKTTSTTKNLTSDLLDHIGLERLHSMRTEDVLWKSASENLKAAHCRVLVLDEVQRVTRGRALMDFCKKVMDELKVVVVVVGTGLDERSPIVGGVGNEASPIAARSEIVKLLPFPKPVSVPGADHTWTDIVRSFENHIRLLDHEPGSLVAASEELWDRYRGNLAQLNSALFEAVADAEGRELERVILADLEAIPLPATSSLVPAG